MYRAGDYICKNEKSNGEHKGFSNILIEWQNKYPIIAGFQRENTNLVYVLVKKKSLC